MWLARAGGQGRSFVIGYLFSPSPLHSRRPARRPSPVCPLNCIFCIAAQVTRTRRTDGRGRTTDEEWRTLISAAASAAAIMIPAEAPPRRTAPRRSRAKAVRSDSTAGCARARLATAYERKSGRNGRSTRGTTVRSLQPILSVCPSSLIGHQTRCSWLCRSG